MNKVRTAGVPPHQKLSPKSAEVTLAVEHGRKLHEYSHDFHIFGRVLWGCRGIPVWIYNSTSKRIELP